MYWGTIFCTVGSWNEYVYNMPGLYKSKYDVGRYRSGIEHNTRPYFNICFDLGVKGAALATIISQAVSAVWVVAFLAGKKTGRLKKNTSK